MLLERDNIRWSDRFPGNAHLFKTGDWRSMKPVWNEEKCKQCLLCNRYVLIHP